MKQNKIILKKMINEHSGIGYVYSKKNKLHPVFIELSVECGGHVRVTGVYLMNSNNEFLNKPLSVYDLDSDCLYDIENEYLNNYVY